MSNILFSVNTNRYSPYSTYRFLVYFPVVSPTVPVAAVSKVGALKRTSDVIEYKEGGNAIILKGLGRTKYDAIMLERGVTQNADFATWANYAQDLDQGHPTTSLKSLRREVRIELLNEEGQPVLLYAAHRCWVSEYQALPDLDAGANSIAIEHIKMENEGWEQIPLPEPTET